MHTETFQVPEDYELTNEEGEPLEPGWYWWYCRPGCLPDSDAVGPFASEEEADNNATEEAAELAWETEQERRVDAHLERVRGLE